MPTWDEHGYRHSRRIYINRQRKRHDRFKVKLAKMLPTDTTPKYRRFRLWARDTYRQRTAPATGYGVSYD